MNEMKNHDEGRRVEGDRLVYYNKTADQGFWEEVWLKDLTRDYYEPFRKGKLFTFERIFKRHLPKHGLILEAGCGTAQLVTALTALEYDCIGLDFAVKTLRKAQELAGPLQLISGDLTTLGFSDNAFDAIISIGVVEHRTKVPNRSSMKKSASSNPEACSSSPFLISTPCGAGARNAAPTAPM